MKRFAGYLAHASRAAAVASQRMAQFATAVGRIERREPIVKRRTLTSDEFNSIREWCREAPREIVSNRYALRGFMLLPDGRVLCDPDSLERLRFTLELIEEAKR